MAGAQGATWHTCSSMQPKSYLESMWMRSPTNPRGQREGLESGMATQLCPLAEAGMVVLRHQAAGPPPP